jgi:hypothetical protein
VVSSFTCSICDEVAKRVAALVQARAGADYAKYPLFLHIRQEPEFLRVPFQCLAGESAGGWIIDGDEARHPVEMRACFVLCEAADKDSHSSLANTGGECGPPFHHQ